MQIIVFLNIALSALYASALPLEVIFPNLPIDLVRFQANTRKYVLPILWTTSLFIILVFLSLNELYLMIPQSIFVILGIFMHQDMTFREVTNPKFKKEQEDSPIQPDTTVIVVQHNNVVKMYPLLYVAHHHVINDQIGDISIAVTFCPMCHSVVVYDTTEIGRMYVATLHSGNLVLADYKTKTYFQQNTGKYLTGSLKNANLQPLFYEQLSYKRAVEKYDNFDIVSVTKKDLSPFKLPIPGLWKKLLTSQYVPTLQKSAVDKRLPARERVIGIDLIEKSIAYKKSDVLEKGFIQNKKEGFVLVSSGNQVEGYQYPVTKEFSGEMDEIKEHTKIQISDEYWFSWAQFHPMTMLVNNL